MFVPLSNCSTLTGSPLKEQRSGPHCQWMKPTDALKSNFYCYYDSTCFGQPFCPSSGVLSRTSALVHFCRFDDRLLPGAGWRVVILIQIGIQCVFCFHSLGICHDARSYDLKRAVRSFVIHFRCKEKSHIKDTTTARYRMLVLLSRGSRDMVGGIAARCGPNDWGF